jgi:hypothetical protein
MTGLSGVGVDGQGVGGRFGVAERLFDRVAVARWWSSTRGTSASCRVRQGPPLIATSVDVRASHFLPRPLRRRKPTKIGSSAGPATTRHAPVMP